MNGVEMDEITLQAKELSGVCDLEVRPFDFGELPEDVRAFRTFSWKVLILAVMLPDHRFPCIKYQGR